MADLSMKRTQELPSLPVQVTKSLEEQRGRKLKPDGYISASPRDAAADKDHQDMKHALLINGQPGNSTSDQM